MCVKWCKLNYIGLVSTEKLLPKELPCCTFIPWKVAWFVCFLTVFLCYIYCKMYQCIITMKLYCNCRIAEQLKLQGTSADFIVPRPLLKAGSAGGCCPCLCPVGFWILLRMETPWPLFVELHKVPVAPFLLVVEVLLYSSTTIWCINHSFQFYTVCRLAEDGLFHHPGHLTKMLHSIGPSIGPWCTLLVTGLPLSFAIVISTLWAWQF